jgi:hypothetical protein
MHKSDVKIVFVIPMPKTYGTSPMVATTDGRDRIPRAIVSAIMTMKEVSMAVESGFEENLCCELTNAAMPSITLC